jgi:hypothetical protein
VRKPTAEDLARKDVVALHRAYILLTGWYWLPFALVYFVCDVLKWVAQQAVVVNAVIHGAVILAYLRCRPTKVAESSYIFPDAPRAADARLPPPGPLTHRIEPGLRK